MNTKTIRGRLVPSNSEASACAFVRVRLYWSFTENGLREIVTKESKWDDEGISFTSVTSANSAEDLTKFVTALKAVMKTEDAIRLGLTGSFTVTIDEEGITQNFNVTVGDGKVSYEEINPLKTGEEVLV
jgi:hypothetical protein